MTFTDYLDDLSSDYVEYSELLNGNGPLAAALGNRIGEYLGTEPVIMETGTARGNPQKKDWYYIGAFTITYNFIDTGLSGRRRSQRNRSGCPDF